MNWKNRLTNYNFWISLVSAVLLIFQAFNFEFDIANLSEIVTALLGLLVVVGIISNPTKTSQEKKQNDSKTKKEEEKEDQIKLESQNSSKTEQKNNSLKENIESMPSVEQDENNLNSCEDDFKVLVDQISSDIATQTGILKENVDLVVNEIIKTYEEGEYMLETENNDIRMEEEKMEEQLENKEIENDMD
ncbi:MAG: hypothetical protein IKA36_02800, partial [Clostridia bacterium]|nr:hypothetical protein [Clostridia bacterium]